jgi:hypothetical protein
MTYQVSVPVLMHDAALYCARVGAAGTAPAERIVVVPEVTALIVQIPTPMLMMFSTVPIGKAVVAFVGILKVLAEALD